MEIKTLFLNPFRDAAIPIGNSNIVNSIDKRFKLYLLKARSYKSDLRKSDAKIINVSDNLFLRTIQSILISWRLLFKIDLIIGNGNIREVPIVFLAKVLGRKYVFFIHTSHDRFGENKKGSLFGRIKYWSYGYLFKRADALVSISDFVKEGFVRNFRLNPKKVSTVINSVDTDFFDPKKRDKAWLRKHYDIKNNNKNILYLSKLTKTKRAHLIPLIAKKMPEYNFIIQGRNEMGLVLDNYKNIYFSDVRPPRSDIPKIFASADLFIFPSEVEPCAASVTEAMASGLPVVATKGGSVPEQAKDGVNGCIIPIRKGEVDEFVKDIRKILTDDSLRRKFSKASRRISLDFDCKKQGKKYDKVFFSCFE